MTSELPPSNDLTDPWWNATRGHQLILQCCVACEGVQHYPRYVCTHCGGRELGWIAAAGQGIVDTFTVVHRSPLPDSAVPYVVARVRLSEGPVLLTQLVEVLPGEDCVAIGQRVVLRWRDLADGRALPVFAPSAADELR